jgi:hypothetical protein
VALGACAVAAAAVIGAGTLALADSFTPVRLFVHVARVARLGEPLRMRVSVSADAGALDDRRAPLQIQLKLARECGGTFADTRGVVLLDRRLSPQPLAARPYQASASGSGRPRTYGVQTVCAWLVEEGDQRTFASEQSVRVEVSRACTLAAARYDRARRTRGRVRALRHAARRACGPGVRL